MVDLDNGIDYSVGAPGGAAMAEAGFEIACRYLVSATARAAGDKRGLTPAEFNDLKAHGRQIVLILEAGANSMLGGYTIGFAHAKRAQAIINEYESLGMPTNSPVYYTADFDAETTPDFSAIASYLAGAKDARGGNVDIVGCYGEYEVMRYCHEHSLAGLLWQTYAWSHGLLYMSANLYQYDNYGNILNGVDVDYDRALTPNYGQIAIYPTKPPVIKPIPQYPTAVLPDWWADSVKAEAPHNARFTIDGEELIYEVARRNVTMVRKFWPYTKPKLSSDHAGAMLKVGMRLRLERVIYGVSQEDPVTGKITKRDWGVMREGFYVPMRPDGAFRPRVKFY